MKVTLEERIEWVLNNPRVENKTQMLIEEIIKPIAKEAFEAGQDTCKCDDFGNLGYTNMSELWIKEKFNSNKQ